MNALVSKRNKLPKAESESAVNVENRFDNDDISTLRLAGGLFLASGTVFNIGAFWPPREQWYSPLERSLQIIARNRAAWHWIHFCFVVGVCLTIWDFLALAHGLRKMAGGAFLTRLAQTIYLTAAIFWLVNIAFRNSVQVWAATEFERVGIIPAGYEA
jgi:hypothetical protein